MRTMDPGHVRNKAFVLSVAPYVANRKVFGFGPTYHIEAKKAGERFSVTPVEDGVCFKDFGEDQREYYVVEAMDIAKDLVRDCEDMGVWASASPRPSEEEIVAAEERQRQFYLTQIALADSDWARKQDPKAITLHARLGARELGFPREWAKDTSTMEKCAGCAELVSLDAAVCGKCRAVRDWTKAFTLGLLTKEQSEFGRANGLLKAGKAA